MSQFNFENSAGLYMDGLSPRTQQCLAELESRHLNNTSSSNLFLIVGRSGSGKSSFVQDVTGRGTDEPEGDDSATERFQIDKLYIEDKEYYIMDTPGFDPQNETETFLEIVRGLRAIRGLVRVVGVLCFTCINQQRVDAFDHRLTLIVRLICGGDYLPRLTFVTTFWTVAGIKQQAAFNRQLENIQRVWREGSQDPQYKQYHHGREHSTRDMAGKFLNWFENREQIAQQARHMIARHYGRSADLAGCHPLPKLIWDLEGNVAISDTAVGRLLGLRPPSANSCRESESTYSRPQPGHDRHPPPTDSSSSNSSESDPFGYLGSLLRPVVRSPEVKKWATDLFISFISPTTPSRSSYSGPLDRNSAVDAFKFFNLDSSPSGRQNYASRHGIGGTPFSASWNDALRRDALRRHG